MKYSFPGQSALVTGAASGIGEATARLLAANGASVVVSDLQADAVQRVVDAIVADGGKAVANVCDVADAAQVEAAVACAVTHFGALHLAVNNAGIGGDSGPAGEGLHSFELTGVYGGNSWQVNHALLACVEVGQAIAFLMAAAAKNHPLINNRIGVMQSWMDAKKQVLEELSGEPLDYSGPMYRSVIPPT